MIEIEQILFIVIVADIGIFAILIGVVIGQHSVWRHLRKKGHVRIDEWYYTAANVDKAEITNY